MTFLTFGQDVSPMVAYIDPGLLSMAIQGFFILVFGALATYLTAPWRWFASMFRRKRIPADENAAEGNTEREPYSDAA